MGKRKWMGIFIAVLVALLAGPSLSAAAGPERINESFVLGDTGCQMNVVLDGGTGGIVAADLGPAFEPPAPPVVIETDGTWLAWIPPTGCELNDCFPATGWNTNLEFNTTDWKNVPIVYPKPCGGTFPAACIWWDSINSGDHNVFFRKTFNITGSFQLATITGGFDDDGDVYVNGGDAVVHDETGDATDFGPVDITSKLQQGMNLIAAHGIDVRDPFNNFHAQLVIHRSGVPSPPGGIIINSVAYPAAQQSPAVADCEGSLPKGLITDTLVCKDCSDYDGDGTFDCSVAGATCAPKTAVEQNIMEKSGDGSEYCYYTRTGERVCKQI